MTNDEARMMKEAPKSECPTSENFIKVGSPLPIAGEG